MKINFNKINKNLDTYDKAHNIFPQIQEYLDGKIEWETILNYNLNEISDFGGYYKKERSNPSKLKVVTGKTIIDFETLKKKMIKECNRLVAYGNKSAKESLVKYHDSRETDEMVVFMKVKKFLKGITEDEFKSVFTNQDNWDKLFPYLYRLEISIYYKLGIYMNNYLAHHKVEINKDVADLNYDIEYYTKIIKLPESNEVEFEMYKVENSDKVINDYLKSLEKSGSVNWKYLERKLKQAMSNLNRKDVSSIQKGNDRSRIIDKLVD